MSTRKRSREDIDSERQKLMANLKRSKLWSVENASEELRGEYEVALAAVKNYGWNLAYVSKELQNNHKVVLAAVHEYPYALRLASPALQADRAVVTAAVSKVGNSLEHASPELRADRDIVLTALRSSYPSAPLRVLEHASLTLKADEDFVLAAVFEDPITFKCATDSLQSDHDFVARALAVTHKYFSICPDKNHFRMQNWLNRCGTAATFFCEILPFVSEQIKHELRATAREYDTLGQAEAFLHDSLQSHASFMEFLCCVKSKSAFAANKPVTKINLDTATLQKLSQCIAEYAGVPIGQKLGPVRLIKRIVPILKASFRGRDNDKQNLAWLMKKSRISR